MAIIAAPGRPGFVYDTETGATFPGNPTGTINLDPAPGKVAVPSTAENINQVISAIRQQVGAGAADFVNFKAQLRAARGQPLYLDQSFANQLGFGGWSLPVIIGAVAIGGVLIYAMTRKKGR